MWNQLLSTQKNEQSITQKNEQSILNGPKRGALAQFAVWKCYDVWPSLTTIIFHFISISHSNWLKLATRCYQLLRNKSAVYYENPLVQVRNIWRASLSRFKREKCVTREKMVFERKRTERELADTATLVKCISWWYDSVRFRIPHAKPGESPHRIIDEFFCDQSVKSISKTGKCAVTNFRLARNWYPFEIFNSSAEISREENK